MLLICSHPKTREAWFRCVTDWFADAERRASRRVLFDKATDRFDPSRAVELLRFGTRAEPVLHRRPAGPPEELLTNLLPILEHGSRVWSAPTQLSEHWQARDRYDEVGGPRASDYLLRDNMLYALRDPRSCSLRHLCDIEKLTDVAAEDWADSGEPKLLRYWVELLRRNLLHQVKHQLRWERDRRVFFFEAPDPLAELSAEGPNGKRKVVKVEHYFDKRRGEQRLKYVRHHGFRPGFQRIDGRWHLEVEPDYVFTYDGERPNFRGDEYMAGIKRLDKNLAVVGQLRMWEHLLTRPPSLLHPEPGLLTFGELRTVEVPVGIDDAAWRAKDAVHNDDRQDELAA